MCYVLIFLKKALLCLLDHVLIKKFSVEGFISYKNECGSFYPFGRVHLVSSLPAIGTAATLPCSIVGLFVIGEGGARVKVIAFHNTIFIP